MHYRSGLGLIQQVKFFRKFSKETNCMPVFDNSGVEDSELNSILLVNRLRYFSLMESVVYFLSWISRLNGMEWKKSWGMG